MPLWGNVDNAANSDIAVLAQVNKNISTAERTKLYNNVTADVYITGKTVGQFGVDTQEMAAVPAGSAKPTHAGWNLRTVGSGGRAGRVHYETLVAMGSMTGDGEDDVLPDYTILITAQPSGNTWNGPNAVSLTVTAVTQPAGGTLTYSWQQSYAGVPAFTNVAAAGTFSNPKTATLSIANNVIASGNTFRVLVYATGATTAISANAIVTAT